MPGMQKLYVEELRRQAETFGALARLTERHEDTENSRFMAAVNKGLAEVCSKLADALESDLEEAKAVE